MNKKEQHIINSYSDCYKRTKNRKRKCFAKDCGQNAINSHVLWKRGIIKSIATNSKIIGLDFSEIIRKNKPKFKELGLKEFLYFQGFCNPHDNAIFKSIENENVDYYSFKTQKLLSVRSIYHERRKKEINIETIKCFLDKFRITDPKTNKQILSTLENELLGIKDLIFYAVELNKEITDPKGRFSFKVFELDQIPVITSTYFSPESLQTINRNYKFDPNWKNQPMNSFLINIIPNKNKTLLIIGYHNYFIKNAEVLNRIEKLNNSDLLKLISNILIQRIETWACSLEFYECNIKPIEENIITEFMAEHSDFDGKVQPGINMFVNENHRA